MISVLITVVVVILVCGTLAWLIQMAPMIAEPFKSFAVYCLIAVAAIIVIIELVSLTGVHVLS
jgi:hypothetical protein